MPSKKKDKASVRQNEANPMSDLMQYFIKANNLEKGMQKMAVEEEWEKIMGSGVNNYTERIVLKSGTLWVKISSAALRNELDYGKEKIKVLMNEALGEPLIKKVVLS